MIRTVLLIVVLAALALAAAWLAERPGDIAITWMGWRIETSVMVGVAAVAALVAVTIVVWAILRLAWRSPRLIAQARRNRRQRRGQRAVSRGIVAVASGDMRGARRFSGEAKRFAGDEPLALLLQAQTAQLAGDRTQADAAFRAMVEQPETRLLGLRGLYVEAQRRGDMEAGRQHAEEAARSAPALPWAGQAVFDFRCAAGDWAGALAVLERNARNGVIERAAHRRQRAVLLTARALEVEDTDVAEAKAIAAEAAKLAPDFVPAVSLAARLAAESGEWRRAAKLVETAWRADPHPDLAEVYARLRSGDSARDRMARVQQLARLRPGEPEGALALARAALDAQQFTAARAALAPLLAPPSRRAAMLMAELEEAEHGDAGRAREWMGRALRAGGDPRWVADGMASERWLPVSPVSGRLDAFAWTVPPGELAAPIAGDDVLPLRPVESLPLAAAPSEPSAAIETPFAGPATGGSAVPHATGEPASPQPTGAVAAAPTPRRGAVIPLIHAPDDPGPEDDAAAPGTQAPAFPGRTR